MREPCTRINRLKYAIVPTIRLHAGSILGRVSVRGKGRLVQENSDRVNELARRAAGETDSAKLLALLAALNEALDEQRVTAKGMKSQGLLD
jgi:hypothetical protein